MQIHHHQGSFVQDEFRRLNRPPILFLGAGASATSNLPTVADIEWELKLAIYQKESPQNELSGTSLGALSQRDRLVVEDFLQQQTWYQGLNSETMYPALVETVYPTPASREAYFNRLIDGAVPSIGYQHLARLLRNHLFHLVSTTNFDKLLLRCEERLQVVTPEIAFSDQKVKLSSKRPSLLEFHGDYRFNPLSQESLSIREGDEVLRRDLLTMLDDHPLVMLGYSGRDRSIMEMLSTAVSLASMSAGFYWTLLPLNDPPPAAEKLMAKHLARGNPGGFVEITSFDHLMGELVRGYLRKDTTGAGRSTGPMPIASSTYQGALPQSPYAGDDISSITRRSQEILQPSRSGTVNTRVTPSQQGMQTPSNNGQLQQFMNQGVPPTGRFQVMNTPSGQVMMPTPSAGGAVAPSATNIINTPTGSGMFNTAAVQQTATRNTPHPTWTASPSTSTTGSYDLSDVDDLPEPPRTNLGKIVIGVLLSLLAVVMLALNVTQSGDPETSDTPAVPPKPKVVLKVAGSESIGGTLLVANLQKRNIPINGLDAFEYESIGSSKGIEKLVLGEIPLAGSSRMLRESDLDGKSVKIKPYVVAYDAVSVIANGMNRSLKQLSLKELKGVFCGEITEWKQLGHPTLGKIHVLDRDQSSGTRALIDDLVRHGCQTSFEEAHQDVILQTIAQDPNAISYAAASLPLDQGTTTRVALSARKKGEGFLPDENTIFSGAYPLTRPLFFFVREDGDFLKPEVKAFTDWLASPVGVANVRAGGLVAAKNPHRIRSIIEFRADSCSLSKDEAHIVDNLIATAKILASVGNKVTLTLEGRNPNKDHRVKAKRCSRVSTEKELVEKRVRVIRKQLDGALKGTTVTIQETITPDIPLTIPPAWRGTAQHRVDLQLDFE